MDKAENSQGHGPGGNNGGPDPGHGNGGNPPGQQITIIVNGREKPWTKGEISYDQVVALAALPPPPGPNPGYTVTYSNGHGNKPEGTLTPGHSVKVNDGMIFNVTATNQS